MDSHCRLLLDEFQAHQESFVRMEDIVRSIVAKHIKDNSIYIVALESRIKQASSLSRKLELKGHKYSELSDVTDLVGVRVVTVYSEDLNRICSFVEKTFDVDWDNSVDKSKALAPDQVGYMSLHYVCRIPTSLFHDASCPEINEFRFEIQLRTALQHIWATINHDTGYKSNIEIPREYTRKLSRLSGLLEIADEEFSTIIRELTEYRRRVASLVEDGDFDKLLLDGDTYRGYLKTLPFDGLNKRIAAINNSEITAVDLMPFFEPLVRLGFKTIGDIERMRTELEDQAFALARFQLADTDLDIISSSIGLRNLLIVYILKSGYGEGGIHQFLDAINGAKDSNIQSARRMVEIAIKVNIIRPNL